MHLFTCPFCGLRDETEFRFAAEAGKVRPQPSSEATPESWSAWLFMQGNPKGATREIWVHTPCGEFFLMERNSLTHEISGEQAQTADVGS